jgi:hypothetical protein
MSLSHEQETLRETEKHDMSPTTIASGKQHQESSLDIELTGERASQHWETAGGGLIQRSMELNGFTQRGAQMTTYPTH